MEFLKLKKDEYQKFYNEYENASFMQSIELGNLKELYGYKTHYVGIKENDKVVSATLLLESKVMFNKTVFYAPRGLMVDYHDKKLLTFFVENLKKYIKSNKGINLTIDPNIIYRTRNRDGSIIDDKKDDESINNLLDLGFTHHGFNLYLDARQARWCYRMSLDEEYEVKKSKFSKSVRKNIESTYKKGLQVREGTIEDLEKMTEIFDKTAKRKEFFSRSLEYYKNMYSKMSNLMTIYIAYLNPDVYLKHSLENLKIQEDKLKEIEDKFKKDIVGNKLKNDKDTCIRQIEKCKEEVNKAKRFKEEHNDCIDVGCLLSIRSGKEYLTLSSGVLEEYKNFTPKYQMYDYHIKEAYKEGFKYCNFYGITGDFNKDNKYYGIYEFKQGFAGNVIEYIGEFDLEISKFNKIYNLLRKLKHIVKK